MVEKKNKSKTLQDIACDCFGIESLEAYKRDQPVNSTVGAVSRALDMAYMSGQNCAREEIADILFLSGRNLRNNS